jgi:hypothetical protein
MTLLCVVECMLLWNDIAVLLEGVVDDYSLGKTTLCKISAEKNAGKRC